MFHAIITSGPTAEHNNGRLNTIGLGPIGPIHRIPTTTSDNDLSRERSRTLWGKSSGTSWNFIMGLMERNNYDCMETAKITSNFFLFLVTPSF